jgi:geranylgeranyl diphosphate synthase type II
MGAASIPEILEEYGATTRLALADYLGPRAPQRHLYGLVADYPRRGGRMLRPSLCIATARVFGATVEDALRCAAAIELLHNAFLVHDDVEDESEARRGRPTLNALHGPAIAVNVGDALAVLGLRALIDNHLRLGPHLTVRVLQETEHMARESIEGQAVELGWRRDNAISLSDADYLGMVYKKTCWYTTIYPSRLGALIGTRTDRHLDRFVRFGFFLGAAFQIQDDLLNLAGDEARYGKELEGDLWEGKRTLIMIRLLRQVSDLERARLAEFLGLRRTERTAADVRWVRERLEAYGCLEYGRQVAHAFAGAAQHEFSSVYAGVPDSRDRGFIEGLPRWVLERT